MPRPRSDRPYVCGPYKHRRKWRLVVYVPGVGTGGGRSSFRRYFDSAENAEKWKREYRRQVQAAGRTVGNLLDAYVDQHLRRKKENKERSIGTSRYRITALLDLDTPLADITPKRAQQIYDEMVEDGYANDTHHGSLMEARALFGYGVRNKWIKAPNPFEGVEPVGRKRRRKRQLRVDQARALTSHCLAAWSRLKDRSAIAVLMPLYFNLRATETAELKAPDVDDEGRLLWVAYGENDEGEDIAKTETSRRTARVPKHLVPVLRELAASPATPDGHLFALEDGRPADRHWVRYHALRHAKAAKVPPTTTHGLRGTHSSIGVAEGVTAEVMAKAMGHADSGKTALEHYIDPAIAAEAQAARVADSLFEGVPVPIDPESTPRILRDESGNTTGDVVIPAQNQERSRNDR